MLPLLGFPSHLRGGRGQTFGPWLVIVALGLSVAGCRKTEQKAPAAKPAEVFVTQPVAEMVTEYEEVTGRTVAIETVEIRARVSGYLEKAFFKDGDAVQEGDPLFEIDSRQYESELKRAQATVAQSQSRLERLNRELERARQLVERKALSAEDFDRIAFERDEADAALAVAKANEDLAALNLTYTAIKARISGQIGRRLVDPGNLIKADDTLLATLVSVNPIFGYFDIDERTVLKLRRLMQEGKLESPLTHPIEVQVGLADDQEYVLSGKIDFVDNQLEASSGTLRARAIIDNSTLLLSPGLFVRLRIPIGVPREAVLVPEEALGTDQGQRFVYVVNDQDEVTYRRVKTGWLSAGRRVIEEGLSPSDRIIVRGLQRVRPGVKVSPQPAEQQGQVARAVPEKLQPASLRTSGGAR